MADDLLADATNCLALLRESLDGARLATSDESTYAPHAIALLSRLVHLCEAAFDVVRTERRSAAAVVVRPALECWIDCCYVLYCKWEAVLQLTFLDLRERQKLAKIWLGEEPVDEIVEQLAALGDVVVQGRAAGMLSADFKLRTSFSLEARLSAAIKARGAAPSYIDVYDYLYRAISMGEIHTSGALEFHAVHIEDEFVFSITPSLTLDVTVLVALCLSSSLVARHWTSSMFSVGIRGS
jgi:uncharacterized membrane protein YecN with MAPEG domain